MFEKIEVIRENSEKNEKLKWVFWYYNHTLFLDDFTHSAKRDGKRNCRIESNYTRLSKRNSTLSEQEVDIPEDVKIEALKKFVEKLSIKKWSES